MAWQQYIDISLMVEVDGNRLTSSAIVGLDGSIWAQSPNFPTVNGIMGEFNSPGSLDPTGLYIGGTKYTVIEGKPGAVIQGNKGSGGATIKKTNQSLIFGIYDEPMTLEQCSTLVEKLGDYLIDQGY